MDIERAVQRGDVDKVRDFLELGIRPDAGRWAGHLFLQATIRNLTAVMRLLIDAGADPHERSSHGWTTLMHAASQSYEAGSDGTDALRFLLDHGVDLNARSHRGWTALMRAVADERLDKAEVLLRHGADRVGIEQAQLAEAMRDGRADDIESAVRRGAQIDAIIDDSVGWTALGWAAARGDAAAVRQLLELGAAADAPDERNLTPLGKAVTVEEWQYHEGHEEVVRLLLTAGADPNRGQLTFAVYEEYDTIRDLLVAAGADLHAATIQAAELRAFRTRPRNSPEELSGFLWIVIREGRIDKVPKFFDGADVGAQHLMVAAEFGRSEVIPMLLSRGVDPNGMSTLGETALKNAALGGHEGVIRLLLEAGVSLRTADATIARRWAQAAGHGSVVALLE